MSVIQHFDAANLGKDPQITLNLTNGKRKVIRKLPESYTSNPPVFKGSTDWQLPLPNVNTNQWEKPTNSLSEMTE